MKYIVAIILILPAFLSFIRKDYLHDRRTRRNKIISQILLFVWIIAIPIYVIKETESNKEKNNLKNSLEIIQKQNVSLLAGKDSLLVQNESLLNQIKQYQFENEGLRQTLKIQFYQTYRMIPFPEGGIGITTPYKSLLYHYNTALDEYQKGNIASAKIILEMLLEEEPNYPNGLCLLGIILNELGRPNDALLLLDKAYSISKDKKFINNIELIKKSPGKKINVTVINK